jgi:hypothetical protein
MITSAKKQKLCTDNKYIVTCPYYEIISRRMICYVRQVSMRLLQLAFST